MHHSVQEGPKQDVSEKAPDETAGEEQPPRLEAFVPPPARFEDEQQGEEEGGQEVKDEAVESRQSQDAGCRSGQSRHGRAAVIQHSGVSPHGNLADELRPLSFGPDSCHPGSGSAVNRGKRRIHRFLIYKSDQQQNQKKN